MRNLGVFTRHKVANTIVERLILEKGGIIESLPNAPDVGRTVALGADLDWVYVDTDTSLKEVCFDDEEFEVLKTELGFEPQGYIDLHFTSTSGAYELAENLALEMKALWDGVVDYEGAGGGLGMPPEHR